VDAAKRLAPLFADAGVIGHLHALDVATGTCVGYAADEPVVPASVFKIGMLVEMFRRVDAGELDPAEPVSVPVGGRTSRLAVDLLRSSR